MKYKEKIVMLLIATWLTAILPLTGFAASPASTLEPSAALKSGGSAGAPADLRSPIPSKQKGKATGEGMEQLKSRAAREITEKRSRNTKLFQMNDGSYQAIVAASDLHYEDQQGRWQDIQTDLVDEVELDNLPTSLSKAAWTETQNAVRDIRQKRNNQKLDRNQTYFRALHIPFNVKIPKNIQQGYSIGIDQNQLTLIPQQANASLGIVQREAGSVTYTRVWPQTDLTLKVLPMGVKETIVLKDKTAPAQISFEVIGNKGDRLQWEAPWLQDANGTIRDVQMQERTSGGRTFLDLTWDSDLVYPLVIDPTVTVVRTNSTVIDSSQPSTCCLESSSGLYVGGGGGPYGYSFDTYGVFKEALLRFNLASIPANAVVTQSSLNLFVYGLEGTNGGAVPGHSLDVKAYSISNTWNPYTSWNSRPLFNSLFISSAITVTSADNSVWRSTDLTTYVQAAANPNSSVYSSNQVSVMLGGANGYRDYVRMAGGYDTAHSPYLSICYDYVPGGLSPGNTASSPQLMSSFTPTLTWSYSNPTTGGSQNAYEVQIYNAAGTTLLHDSGWVNAATASYTVPANLLTGGTVYSWKVAVKDSTGLVSLYSRLYYVKTRSLPVVAVTSYTNGQQLPGNSLTLTWSYTDATGQAQTAYRIRGSNDNWATVGYDSGVQAGTATSWTTPLLADGVWSFQITASNGTDWSAAAVRNNLMLYHEYEPNDTSGQATPISYNANVPTLLHFASDVDFFSYTASSVGLDRIVVAVAANTNCDVYIYNSSLQLVASGTNGVGVSEELLFRTTANATYFIKVVGNGAASAAYTLHLNRVDVLDYHYDSAGRLESIRVPESGKVLQAFQYDPNGNLVKIIKPY